MNKLFFSILFLLLASCASQVPKIISTPPKNDISVTEAQVNPKQFSSASVRWGGTIVKVENKKTNTWIEIVSRQLDSIGKPIVDSQSAGRFIANIDGFIDPIVFSAGRSITVVGKIVGETTQSIGDFTYQYPIVSVEFTYLWPTEAKNVNHEPYYPPPWYYDPWYYNPWPRWPYYW